ncbi:MAG: major royal jelly family protein, partial [Thermoproteota archaeon]|nr:major royal jelly family protein [Thermoproteota archaeon]
TNPEDLASMIVSVQSIVGDLLDPLRILDSGKPLSGPLILWTKLVGIDLNTDSITRLILFPRSVAFLIPYLNDIHFDLRHSTGGMAFITYLSQRHPNGIIVVDLNTEENWHRLNNHHSTKPEGLKTFLPIVVGRTFLKHPQDGSVKQGPAWVLMESLFVPMTIACTTSPRKPQAIWCFHYCTC